MIMSENSSSIIFRHRMATWKQTNEFSSEFWWELPYRAKYRILCMECAVHDIGQRQFLIFYRSPNQTSNKNACSKTDRITNSARARTIFRRIENFSCFAVWIERGRHSGTNLYSTRTNFEWKICKFGVTFLWLSLGLLMYCRHAALPSPTRLVKCGCNKT